MIDRQASVLAAHRALADMLPVHFLAGEQSARLRVEQRNKRFVEQPHRIIGNRKRSGSQIDIPQLQRTSGYGLPTRIDRPQGSGVWLRCNNQSQLLVNQPMGSDMLLANATSKFDAAKGDLGVPEQSRIMRDQPQRVVASQAAPVISEFMGEPQRRWFHVEEQWTIFVGGRWRAVRKRAAVAFPVDRV